MDKTQLQKAYDAARMWHSLGLDLSPEQRELIRAMETDYLQEEIIPLLKSELEPLFSKLRCGMKISLHFNPETGVDIRPLIELAREMSDDFESKPKSTRTRKFKIRVVFPNNTVSCKMPVLETFLDVVRYAGPEKVQDLNIMEMGDNIVSTRLHPNPRYRVGQKEIKPGLYVCTYSSTDTKFELIKVINKRLNLGLQIEKVLI